MRNYDPFMFSYLHMDKPTFGAIYIGPTRKYGNFFLKSGKYKIKPLGYFGKKDKVDLLIDDSIRLEFKTEDIFSFFRKDNGIEVTEFEVEDILPS